MMIDYISATTSFDDKDTILFSHLQQEAAYNSGWDKYYLQGCERLAVWVHPALRLLRLEGSVAYYWQGHNFAFNRQQFFAAIDYIKGLLRVDIWQATLNAFEYGIIIEVQMKPKEYIQHKYAESKEKLTLNEKGKDKGQFRWWQDNLVKLKMYDARRNILMKQGLHRQDIIGEAGWQQAGEYLKWEAHYIKPEALNHGKGLHLYQLVAPDWQPIFKEDIYLQYKRLIPMKNIITPSRKKDLTTADILLLTMAEKAVNEGQTREELKKILYAKINSISDNILTKSDKDYRKKQIRDLLTKIEEAPNSIYDLSEELAKALAADK